MSTKLVFDKNTQCSMAEFDLFSIGCIDCLCSINSRIELRMKHVDLPRGHVLRYTLHVCRYNQRTSMNLGVIQLTFHDKTATGT